MSGRAAAVGQVLAVWATALLVLALSAGLRLDLAAWLAGRTAGERALVGAGLGLVLALPTVPPRRLALVSPAGAWALTAALLVVLPVGYSRYGDPGTADRYLDQAGWAVVTSTLVFVLVVVAGRLWGLHRRGQLVAGPQERAQHLRHQELRRRHREAGGR